MTRTTLSHRTARRARSAASTAALCLSAFALAACSGGATGDATASADAPVESAASDAGGSATTAEGSSSGASGESSGSTDGESSSSSSGGSGGVASGSYLTEPGPAPTGDIAKTGAYGLIGEPGTVDYDPATVGESDNFQIGTTGENPYSVACEGEMQLGGDPVPCTFTDDAGTVLKGEAVYARIAGGTSTIIVGHVIGSDGKDPALAASGDTELLIGYYGQDPAGPESVKDEALAEILVDTYGWKFGDGEPMPESIKASCTVEEGGLHATCTLSGADDKSDGEYTATYQPSDDGRPLYVFTPSAPQ